MKITLFGLLVLCLSSCSGSKQGEAPVAVNSTKTEVKVVDNLQTEEGFNSVAAKLNNKEIDLKEAGKLIGEILEQDQNSDLINFNYEKNNQLFSTFTQTLKGHFGAQSDGALVFLSQVLKVNSLEGFESLSREEKEKAILVRIGALREKSYLELEFFLANYFLNNKIFESLKTQDENSKAQDLTFCKGHLIKFVKDIYAKNSRYPEAFSKYAIWGEVLSDCNLAPIYLPSLGSVKISPVKLEHVILANILKSPEAKSKKWSNLRFEEKTPALVKSLISHISYVSRALGNGDQVLFNLNTINNALIQLDNATSVATDGDDALMANLADNLWHELYFPLRSALADKQNLLIQAEKKTDSELHPILKSLVIEFSGQANDAQAKQFLTEPLELKKSMFLTKWNLIKDSLMIRAYVSSLTKNTKLGNESLLHELKGRLDSNIEKAKILNGDLNFQSESEDSLYVSLAQKFADTQYVASGMTEKLESLNFDSGPVIIHILSKVETSLSSVELNLKNVKTGYFDFTPNKEITSPDKTPFVHEMPRYRFNQVGETRVKQKTDFGCVEWAECPDNFSTKACNSFNRCNAYGAYVMRLETILPLTPNKPAKMTSSQSGIVVAIDASHVAVDSDVMVVANGQNGKSGVQGTDSKFCMNGIYNTYGHYKNGDYVATTASSKTESYAISRVGSTKVDSEAGKSGDGGDGGAGGVISVINIKAGVSLMALGGLGGKSGAPASCNTIFDRSRELNSSDPRVISLLGNQGATGVAGKIIEVDNEI